VEDGHFRDDLYFRLSALTLRLPSLKDRKEDLPALLDAFAARHGGPPADRFDVEAMNALLGYGYPGNVRELENEVRRLAAQTGSGPVRLVDVDQKFSGEHVELALKESDDLKEIVGRSSARSSGGSCGRCRATVLGTASSTSPGQPHHKDEAVRHKGFQVSEEARVGRSLVWGSGRAKPSPSE
jgi:DNA-binding NtrC family response regulator